MSVLKTFEAGVMPGEDAIIRELAEMFGARPATVLLLPASRNPIDADDTVFRPMDVFLETLPKLESGLMLRHLDGTERIWLGYPFEGANLVAFWCPRKRRTILREPRKAVRWIRNAELVTEA